jgi:hypothetical protein
MPRSDKKNKLKNKKKPNSPVLTSEEVEILKKEEQEVLEKYKTIDNPIFNTYFKSLPFIPGKIYDAESSRLYRAQTALRTLFNDYKPSSEVLFEPKYVPIGSPLGDYVYLDARALWLKEDDKAQHWSQFDNSERIVGGAGIRRRERFEQQVTSHITRIANIIKKFKR